MTMQEKLEKEITTTTWFIEDKEELLDFYIQKVRTLIEKESNDSIGNSLMHYAKDVSETYVELKTMRMYLRHLKMLECQEE